MGEHLYRIWAEAMRERGVGVEQWRELGGSDRTSWEELADRIVAQTADKLARDCEDLEQWARLYSTEPDTLEVYVSNYLRTVVFT